VYGHRVAAGQAGNAGARVRKRDKEGGGVERAGLASASGPERRARASKERKRILQFLFSNKFQITTSINILSRKMTFFGNGPKMKVA
jgi:hypothetical protein